VHLVNQLHSIKTNRTIGGLFKNKDYFIVLNNDYEIPYSPAKLMVDHELKTKIHAIETLYSNRFLEAAFKGICAASLMFAQSVVYAEDYTQSPYFKGGKLDSNFNYYDNGDFANNNILWTPAFKGGGGTVISQTGGQDINYYGGYVRPLVAKPEIGELFLGAQQVLQGDRISSEVQGEYRLPNGLGVGGGFVDRSQSTQDAKFASVSYKNQWQDFKYQVTTQWQSFNGKDYGGGYLAAYNKEYMLSYGNDGEQWRSTFGYVAPQITEKLRPALEVLYVDNSIGKIGTDKSLMVSGSLGFSKGFLSHEARLGRAMGPTGMQFSNPLGYLNTGTDPTFNRRAESWELGGLFNFRYINTSDVSGKPRTETFEANMFPAQFFDINNLLSSVFIGGGLTNPNGTKPYKSTLAKIDQAGVSGSIGYIKRFGAVDTNVRLQHDFNVDDTQVYVGAQYWL
jgi:hypothetical protein